MKSYFVDKIFDKTKAYYSIRDNTGDIVPLETKYLIHKMKSKISPYTIRKSAYSLCYYLTYRRIKDRNSRYFSTVLCKTKGTLYGISTMAKTNIT